MKTRLIHIFLLMGLLVCFGKPALGQDSITIKNQKFAIYTTFDEPPIPPGGNEGYVQYIKKNIKYPKEALAAKASGTVDVEMIINKNGTISDVHIEKDRVGYGCGEEAVRIIKSMPPWKPGKNEKGEILKVKYVVPVKFVLP